MSKGTSFTYGVGYKDGAWDGYKLAKSDMRPLLDAAIKTLQDNLHLCDGDNCTMKSLRDAVSKIVPNWEEYGK